MRVNGKASVVGQGRAGPPEHRACPLRDRRQLPPSPGPAHRGRRSLQPLPPRPQVLQAVGRRGSRQQQGPLARERAHRRELLGARGRGIIMGLFRVPLQVGNPSTGQTEIVDAVVDTGAVDSVMPASLLRRLGIEPMRTVRYRTASGERVEYEVGSAYFSAEGFRCIANVAFGAKGLTPCWVLQPWNNSI